MYVYGGKGTYNIGYSKDPERRIAPWPLMPWPCELVLTIKSRDAIALESFLHQHFASKRLNGEWFKLSQADIIEIPNLAKDLKLRYVLLGRYLRKLELSELDKPPSQRREVPTITELAEAAGISRVAMSNLANDNLQSVNLRTLSAVLNELRLRGFKTELTDLLATYPLEAA